MAVRPARPLQPADALRHRLRDDAPVALATSRHSFRAYRQRVPASRSESGMPLFSLWRACPRHFRYPRRAANAPTMALKHHTAIAAYANGDDKFLIEAPSAV